MNKKTWMWRVVLLLSLLCVVLYYWLYLDWMLTVGVVGVILCVIRSYVKNAQRREEYRREMEEDEDEEEQEGQTDGGNGVAK